MGEWDTVSDTPVGLIHSTAMAMPAQFRDAMAAEGVIGFGIFYHCNPECQDEHQAIFLCRVEAAGSLMAAMQETADRLGMGPRLTAAYDQARALVRTAPTTPEVPRVDDGE